MAPSTDRQLFRETVAQVAAKAKAILPATVNGRVESAVKLVLAGDVEMREDGAVQVFSRTDPTRRYVLSGPTCTCTDFVQQKAPEGWCAHRIAAGIDKRVQELLAAMPAPAQPQEAQSALPEAPASVNVRLAIAGREVQLTLRDTDETRLLARLTAVLAQYPQPQPAPSQPTQGQGWCAIHDCAMHETVKDGRRWFSHKTPAGWCTGRSPRPPSGFRK